MHMCDITDAYVWHDSCICVTWLMHMCDMPPLPPTEACIHRYESVRHTLCINPHESAWHISDVYAHIVTPHMCTYRVATYMRYATHLTNFVSCRHIYEMCHVTYRVATYMRYVTHLTNFVRNMTRTWHTLYAIAYALVMWQHILRPHVCTYRVATHETSCCISHKVCQVTNLTYCIWDIMLYLI